MASSAPFVNNQTAPPRDRNALGAAPAIEPRGIPMPERKQPRRTGQDGKVGSQKATRYAFSAVDWRAAGAEGQEAWLKEMRRGGKRLEAVSVALIEGLRIEQMLALEHLERNLNRKRRLQGFLRA